MFSPYPQVTLVSPTWKYASQNVMSFAEGIPSKVYSYLASWILTKIKHLLKNNEQMSHSKLIITTN